MVRIEEVIKQGEKALSNDTGKELLERMIKLEVVVEAAKEALEEIEYWHGNMLSEEERNHPRGSGWARVYDKLVTALAELEGDKDERSGL